MAVAPASESDDEYYSLSGQESNIDEDEADSDSIMEPPVHPVPSMQGAFEESIVESSEDHTPLRPGSTHDAEGRRKKLLEAQQYNDAWRTRWEQRPGARHHPTSKLVAQIVFGMHLLQQGAAKSNEEVVKILQTHVNEVDAFLERTAEDFDLAIGDIRDRMHHLKLPMEHLDVFETMLDDKRFRSQLLEGNDNIEKIIDRTAKAMNAALMDVRKALEATEELGRYLDGVRESWPSDFGGISEVYGAMRGNQAGWIRFLGDLKAKGKTLDILLVQLGVVIANMSKLAAAASRRNAAQSRAISPARSAWSAPPPRLRSKFAYHDGSMPRASMSLNKPLPREPDAVRGASRSAALKAYSVPLIERYEKPRQLPATAAPKDRRASSMPNHTPPRSRTAGAPRGARETRADMSELAEFLRSSGPLRSNPPNLPAADRASSKSTKSLGTSQRLGNDSVIDSAEPRIKTHSAAVILRSAPSGPSSERPSSRGAEQTLQSHAQVTGRPSPAGIAFARRISTRMKHLTLHDDGSDVNDPPSRAAAAAPTESRHAPKADSAPSLVNSVAMPDTPSRLVLFPKALNLRTPVTGSMRGTNGNPHTMNGMVQTSPRNAAPSVNNMTEARSLSIRNIFHRRQKTQAVV